MINYIDGRLHIIDNFNSFGDPNEVMVGELLGSVLEAAELCLDTAETYVPDALNLIRLAKILLPSEKQFQDIGDAIAQEDLDEILDGIEDESVCAPGHRPKETSHRANE